MSVYLKDLAFDFSRGSLDCLQLVQDIDALVLIIHHAGEPAHLPFYTFKSVGNSGMVCELHC